MARVELTSAGNLNKRQDSSKYPIIDSQPIRSFAEGDNLLANLRPPKIGGK
jgi:hypothetical protein